MNKEVENWMTLNEAAAYMAMSIGRMQSLMPEIPGAKKIAGRSGGEWRVKASMLDDYFDEMRIEP